jgi:hypothetical protein
VLTGDVLSRPAVRRGSAEAGAALAAAGVLVVILILATTQGARHAGETERGRALDEARGRSGLPEIGPAGGAIRKGDSVAHYDKDGNRIKRVDLDGRGHNWFDTPHIHDSSKTNTGPDGVVRAGKEKGVRKASPDE